MPPTSEPGQVLVQQPCVPILQWKMRLTELGDFHSHLSIHHSDNDPRQSNSFQYLSQSCLWCQGLDLSHCWSQGPNTVKGVIWREWELKD